VRRTKENKLYLLISSSQLEKNFLNIVGKSAKSIYLQLFVVSCLFSCDHAFSPLLGFGFHN
jgi:hypothetical protein